MNKWWGWYLKFIQKNPPFIVKNKTKEGHFVGFKKSKRYLFIRRSSFSFLKDEFDMLDPNIIARSVKEHILR